MLHHHPAVLVDACLVEMRPDAGFQELNLKDLMVGDAHLALKLSQMPALIPEDRAARGDEERAYALCLQLCCCSLHVRYYDAELGIRGSSYLSLKSLARRETARVKLSASSRSLKNTMVFLLTRVISDE